MLRRKIQPYAFAFAIAGIVAGSAQAADFPGKGSRLLWGYALQNYTQANHYMSQERYEQAVDQYNQAIDRYPYDPDFYANLGVAYTKLGDFTAAEKSLKAAAQLNKGDWMPWSNLANVYAKQNKLKEALPIFELALKCNPPKAEIDPIKNNIAGIKRILNAQARFQDNAKASTARKSGSKVKSDSASIGLAKPGTNKHEPADIKERSSSEPDPASLKKSGWDWSY